MNRRRIVLVEDNPDDVELTVTALQEQSLTDDIVTLKNGREALDYFFARGPYGERDVNDTPALLLLDLKLPKIDGLEVLRQLREHPATKFLPVVVLTSSVEEKDVVESYRLGVNSYVRKPLSFDAFRDAARQLGVYWLTTNYPPPPR